MKELIDRGFALAQRLTGFSRQFIVFLLVGVLNTAFGYGVYALFIFLGLHYAAATFLSTVLGILFNFKTIGVIVFKSRNNRLLFRFFGVYGICYLINITCLKAMTLMGLSNMYLAGLILVLPLALLAFYLNKRFVFRGRST